MLQFCVRKEGIDQLLLQLLLASRLFPRDNVRLQHGHQRNWNTACANCPQCSLVYEQNHTGASLLKQHVLRGALSFTTDDTEHPWILQDYVCCSLQVKGWGFPFPPLGLSFPSPFRHSHRTLFAALMVMHLKMLHQASPPKMQLPSLPAFP